MACQVIHYWTFSGLVGAFLDLAIAYLLLCASTFAFFASKFLGIFGLCLPCPCNGLFGNANRNYCAQRLLLDCPIEQVSSVQFSAKSKFPFDSVFAKDRNSDSNMKMIGHGNNSVDGFVEFEGEGSCSLNQIAGGKDMDDRGENGVMSSRGVKERRLDGKGKRVINERPKGIIRRHRKGGFGDGKLSSGSARDLICSRSISGTIEEHNEAIRVSDEGEAPMAVKLGERAFDDFQLSQRPVETKPDEVKGDEKNTIRYLKQKLEEEHAAHAALYLELEEERNAAATAADEAMAMIFRLQEEKASIEMEARQYQRMIEEKATYDAEEMNILKEILLRREREKHFLEKEVEAYRQMNCLGNEEFEGDARDPHRRIFDSSLDLSEDPSLMLHRLSESIDKKERVKDRYLSNPIRGWDEHGSGSKQGNLEREISHVLKYISDCNQELHEKKMISVDNDPYPQPSEGQMLPACLSSYESSSQEHNFPSVGENQGQSSQSLFFEEEVRVHDIHVIGEKQGKNGQNGQNSPSTSTMDTPTDINRSSTEMTTGLPPMGPRGKSVISDLRRNSTSALDNERLKIDSEVAWLRERLRVVQEGREKLNLSAEYREREKLQLQLLEDIVLQLQEIRQWSTDPGKAVRQVSLPLPSSKVMLQKKRCRSASLGVDKSS